MVKHRKEYSYTNYLKRCPNCGAQLSDKDYDCPHCEINLVGYNEEDNRADNLIQCADEFDKLVKRNNRLKQKAVGGDWVADRYNKFKMKFAQIIIAVILFIMFVMLFLGI